MIKFCRIDDKLLHGQIVMAWTRYVGAEHIVVVNDEAATDQFKKMTLGLAKPAGVGLSVFTVEDAIKKLGAGTKKIIMVILGNTNDTLNLINGVSEIKEINYGGIRQKENSKKFGDAVFLDEKDIENSKKILEKGVNINIQQLPTIPAVDIKTLL